MVANVRGGAQPYRTDKVCRNSRPVSKLFFKHSDKENIFTQLQNAMVHVRKSSKEDVRCAIVQLEIGFGLAFPEGDACDPAGTDRNDDSDDAIKCRITVCEVINFCAYTGF